MFADGVNVTDYVETKIMEIYGTQSVDPGWVVLGIITSDRVEATYKSELNQYQQPNQVQTGAVVASRSFLLLGRKRDAILEELRADVVKHFFEQQKTRKAADEAEKREKELTAQVKKLEGDVVSAKSAAKTFQDQLTEAREAKRKMETDLAKVRTAVGDIKFKEILATS